MNKFQLTIGACENDGQTMFFRVYKWTDDRWQWKASYTTETEARAYIDRQKLPKVAEAVIEEFEV